MNGSIAMARVGVLILSVTAGGCVVPAINVSFTPPAPSAEHLGDIAVQIVDARQPGRGGSNTQLIGQETNDYGAVLSLILAQPGQDPATVFRSMIPAALAHAGYRVVDPGPNVPTMTVSVQEFWLTGTPVFLQTLSAGVTLTPAGATAATWSDTLSARTTTTFQGTHWRPAIEGGYRTLLDQAVASLAEKVRQPAFLEAYARATGAPVPSLAAPPPPPGSPPAPGVAPPPVAAPAAGCRLNSDCPVGQYCAEGRCNVECREDRDCNTGQICNTQNGRCE